MPRLAYFSVNCLPTSNIFTTYSWLCDIIAPFLSARTIPLLIKKAYNMNHLPVSRKVYADISSRISTTLAHSPASEAEAMRLVDSFLQGETPASQDLMAMLAFGMIRAELERAMARSGRARERARARKATQAGNSGTAPTVSDRQSLPSSNRYGPNQSGILTPLPLYSDISPYTSDQSQELPTAPEIKLSRRSRRLLDRLNRPKKKWGAIM